MEFYFSRKVYGMRIGMSWFASSVTDRKGLSKMVYVLPEPQEDVPEGFRKTSIYTMNVVDLTATEEEIFRQFHRNTRYEIGLAKRHPISVGFDVDYSDVDWLMRNFAKKKGIKFLTWFTEKELAHTPHLLVEGFYAGHLAHVSLLLINGGFAHQVCTGSFGAVPEQVRSILARTSHFEAMKKLKAEGLTAYSFGAISPKHPSIEAFKLSFGGKQQPLVSYEKVYNPALKVFYRLRDGNA